MNIPMFVFILLFGDFMKIVMTYNKFLTYTIRFNKITLHPNITGNYTIDQYKGVQYINGYLHVDTKESLNEQLKVVVKFERCNQEGINCEYFQTWSLIDTCSKLKEKNQLWSNWYDNFDPPVRCPLPKNPRIRNATVAIGPVFHLYPDAIKYQWKVTQMIYDNNKFIGSYTIFGSIFGYRKH